MDDGGCPRCCLCTANDDDYDDDESLFNSTEPNSQRHVMLMAIDRMCYAVWFTVVCSGNDTSTWRWCSRRWLWERWATDRRKSLLENPGTNPSHPHKQDSRQHDSFEGCTVPYIRQHCVVNSTLVANRFCKLPSHTHRHRRSAINHPQHHIKKTSHQWCFLATVDNE